MKTMHEQVGEFHVQILGLEPPDLPTLRSQEWILERARFLIEETTEFTGAGVTGDIVAAADGLADIVYVALGTAWMMGIPMEAIFAHVHNCNMKKVRGVGTRGNLIDAVKPDGWQKPEPGIAKLIGDVVDRQTNG